MLRSLMYKSLLMVKFGGVIAKLSLFCSAVSTIATILNDIEFEMGGAIDAVCVVTYLVAIWFSSYDYERTKHIPPVDKKAKSFNFTSDKLSNN